MFIPKISERNILFIYLFISIFLFFLHLLVCFPFLFFLKYILNRISERKRSAFFEAVPILTRGPKTWQLNINARAFSLQVMSLFLENHVHSKEKQRIVSYHRRVQRLISYRYANACLDPRQQTNVNLFNA